MTPIRLSRRWQWTIEDDGFGTVASAGDVVLAFSHNTGVVALCVNGGRAEFAWRHPKPPGEGIGAKGTLLPEVDGSPSGSLFLTFQEAWSAPILRSLRVADGSIEWERRLGQGTVYSVVSDHRYVYVHHCFKGGAKVRVFDVTGGGERHSFSVPSAISHLRVPGGDTAGVVLYGVGRALVEIDAVGQSDRLLDATPPAEPLNQHFGSVLAVRDRAYVCDSSSTIWAVDRSTAPASRRWTTTCPDDPGPDGSSLGWSPDLGWPVYDPESDTLVACGLNGAVYCLDGTDGHIRWITRATGRSSSQIPGVPALLRTRAGSFVVFPGVDEAVYLADAATGRLLDRVEFAPYGLESALYRHPVDPLVLVPHGLGVTAFEVVEGE